MQVGSELAERKDTPKLENTPLVLNRWGANSTRTPFFSPMTVLNRGGVRIQHEGGEWSFNKDTAAEVGYDKFEL